MSWTTRDPRSYPARFPASIREAVAYSPSPVLFGGFATRSRAQAESTLHRQYRFLIRRNPGTDFFLTEALEVYSWSIRIIKSPLQTYDLWLTAKPNYLKELSAIPEISV